MMWVCMGECWCDLRLVVPKTRKGLAGDDAKEVCYKICMAMCVREGWMARLNYVGGRINCREQRAYEDRCSSGKLYRHPKREDQTTKMPCRRMTALKVHQKKKPKIMKVTRAALNPDFPEHERILYVGFNVWAVATSSLVTARGRHHLPA
ncbi:hypothetical protein BDQ17DRAFT_108083 [Cyathus striatus]|nr:hypothetical protein BDQ17DRAFT_108083 [Cyathus striatus]